MPLKYLHGNYKICLIHVHAKKSYYPVNPVSASPRWGPGKNSLNGVLKIQAYKSGRNCLLLVCCLLFDH